MSSSYVKIVLIFFLFGCSYLFPQPQTISIKLKEKKLPFGLKEYVPEQFPEVALALSGGGARGLSQIGVLKALIEAGVPIDIIVGTSMGSIVGGLYAAGYSVRELDSIAVNTDWDDLLSLDQQADRTELFVDEKVTQDRAVFSLRLDGLNPVLPTSFINGQKLSNYLNILAFSAPVHSLRSFDDFKVKFRAVSTNLVTGESVVIKDGPLGKALRASSSVSFFLPPVKLDSLILVDGGLTANIPVEFAKQTGGDFIIAVNTTSPLHQTEELSIPWKIADQVVSIPMKHINNDQLYLADLIIEPEIGKTESTNFDSVRFLIDAGYESVINKIDTIMSELNSLYAANLRKNEFFLYNVKLEGEYTEKEKEIFQILETTDSVSSAAILYALNQLYNSGEFDSLSFNIRAEEDFTYLKLNKYYRPFILNLTLSGISYNSTIEGTSSSPINRYYNPEIISEWLMNYLRDQRKKGFAIKEVIDIEIKDSSTLVINTTEGIINSIEIEGNTLTNDNVILREFPLSEGDFFTINGIEKGLRNLRGTRLFEDIDFFIKRKNGGDAVVIRVEEKESGLLRFGFRVDNEYKAQFGLDIRDENLFGTGAELGTIFFGGTRSRLYILEHKSNRIFDTYLTYKINAFYKFNDVFNYREAPTESERTFSRVEDGEYRQIFYGTSVSVGSQVGKFGNLIFEGKYQVDEIKNIDGDPIDPYDIKLFTIKASSTIDTQDKYPYPENGLFFNASYETAQSFLGGDLGFTKVYFEYQNYFRVSKKHVFSPKVLLGFADKTLPLSEQFSLGGQSSFYGMREYEFRGRQVFLASLMYRYKFPFQIFFDTYLKLRYDLGSTWREQEEIRFKDLRHGIGAELSFDTPIGPAEFAVGRSFLFIKDLPENPISWGDVRVYFSIGYYY